jgi:signal transduction histidine kinase
MTPDDGSDQGERDGPSAAERIAEAERRMADADALLEIASAQLSVAARNIANANAAEREYRRATWHYTQLMKHRITTPLQTIIGMADTLRDMPDLERSRRQAMVEAIGQQARSLRELCMTVDTFEEPSLTRPLASRPAPLDRAVTDLAQVRANERVNSVTGAAGSSSADVPAGAPARTSTDGAPSDDERPLPNPPNVRRFRRSTDR